ncbi:Error-prone lesion bypass DNA polymerase V(UmuC) [Salmonella enterica subsp. arizonae]|uniref:Error-prone lesion bypass DNA polymerase V(UmuC) n=1 Tax=Salmonella enterica subsp. arizonae TaxID=59203 RepID=A0A2X4TEN5_SALER|nr:Error-prone lesion bypass DNA polymerase V(UmuC) [Salmonella enterica subsp. arizonae]VEA47768.1 Error-prone lesion bypass DNA polymerase V(UmuC) [Salmonella enterica subsp. arizonae]
MIGEDPLGGFFSQGVVQLNLFDDNAPRAGSEKLMEVLDHLNAKEGRGILISLGEGIQQQLAMKRDMRSPVYYPL